MGMFCHMGLICHIGGFCHIGSFCHIMIYYYYSNAFLCFLQCSIVQSHTIMSGVHTCGVQQCCATLQQQPSETKYDWADLYKCNKCQCSIYICSLCYQKKPTSGRRHASIRFTRHRLSRHHAQHHSKDMIHVNKRAKVDNMTHKSISTSNIFSEIGNNESTSTTTNDTFSFPYDRRKY